MRTMKATVAIMSRENQLKWDDYVAPLQLAYNTSSHESTGFSPFMLNTGRVPRLPKEGERPSPVLDGNFPGEAWRILQEGRERAALQVAKAWDQRKRRYDASRKEIQLRAGDWVCVRLSEYERNKFPSLKLAPVWSEPCQIVDRLPNNVTYRVKLGGETEVVHVTRLLPLGMFYEDGAPRESSGVSFDYQLSIRSRLSIVSNAGRAELYLDFG